MRALFNYLRAEMPRTNMWKLVDGTHLLSNERSIQLLCLLAVMCTILLAGANHADPAS